MNPTMSLGVNGDHGSAIMMSHGMTLLALTSIADDKWMDDLAPLLVVHPIQPREGEDEYIAVVLNAKLCYIELYAGAQDKGLRFPNGFADDDEDIIDTYTIVEVAMEQVNKKHLEAPLKPTKLARTKKSDAAVGAHETRDKTIATGESSWPKKKSMSSEGELEASKAKKTDGKLSLAATILQENNLTLRTKQSEVEAIYKSLEKGLGQCFPFEQDPLPCKIPVKRIYLAPDSLKYRIFVEKRKEQVQLEREALGMIRRKSELYSIPLKQAPVTRGGP